MNNNILNLMDLDKVGALLEGFNKSTGFVTAILDLEGNILLKSGWRQICTEFHRANPETLKKCIISDTVLANKMDENEKYHFYKCLNGLVDVIVPIIINGEHIANLFSGQFFFDVPDSSFYKKQAMKYGFDEEKYLAALHAVPVVSKERVETVMDFLLNMTRMISDLTFQKAKQFELNKQIIKAKERAEKNEENLSITLHSIGDGVITVDKFGVIDRVNPVALKLCGWNEDEVKGRLLTEVFNIINAYTREPVSNPVEKVIEQGEIVGLANHTVLVARDGREYQIADSAAPIKDKEGNIKGVVLVFSDVSEKYAAEEALKHRENLLNKVFDILPIGLWFADANGRLIRGNPAGVKIWGAEPTVPIEEYGVFKARRHPSGKEIEPDDWALAHTFRKGVTIGDEQLEIDAFDGQKKIILNYTAPVLDEQGNIQGAIVVNQDITEQKKAEDALKAKMNELKRFHKLTVGREITMIELKKEVNDLLNQLGKDSKYKIVE